MPKEKLKVPENCTLEIWVSDGDPIDEGCFAKNSVRLPHDESEYLSFKQDSGESEYLSFKQDSGQEIVIPKYIEIDIPPSIQLPDKAPRTQKFYYFAKGGFNAVFRNFTVNEDEDPNEAAQQLLLFPPTVFKLPFVGKKSSSTAQLDEAKRHVRVFNESNKDVLKKAIDNSKNEPGKYFFGKAQTLGNGSIAPYIIGKHSKYEAICNRLIQLFNETQRIVVDSDVKNNLLTDESKDVWIIDTGFALQLGFEDPINEQEDAMQQASPKSEASFCAWNEGTRNYSMRYEQLFLELLFPTQYNQKFRSETQGEVKKIALIPPELLLSMVLLYIQKEYPGVKNVSCLEDKPDLIAYFAAAYIEQLRKKYFEKSQEMIPALKIKREGEKLISIDETAEKLASLKEQTIDCIELATAGQNDLKTPGSNSFMQVSEVEFNPLLRTAKLNEAKKAILNKIDEVAKKKYHKIPWSISLETPIANIGILRVNIKESKDLEDMEKRLTKLSNTKDVKANKALLTLYRNNLKAIQGFGKKDGLKTQFDNEFTIKYGEHANKLVPLKTELERQILHYIKIANEENKTKAYQLIQDIHSCENRDQIIEKIKKIDITSKYLINCCNITLKPIFKDYSDDLKFCSNQISMITLYNARKTADEAKEKYDKTAVTVDAPNAKLIAQLNKITAELEYRKTLYGIRGAKDKKSWWPWSIDNKLFATEQMLKHVQYLQERPDPNLAKPDSSSLRETELPDIWANKQGKLGDIFNKLNSLSAGYKEIMNTQFANQNNHKTPELTPLSVSSFQQSGLPASMKPSATPTGSDIVVSQSSLEPGVVVAPPSVLKTLSFFAYSDTFDAAKQKITQLLLNEKAAGGAYKGVENDIQNKKNENEIMQILKKYTKDCRDKNLADRLQICIMYLEKNFPGLKPSSEKSASIKP